MRQWFAVKTKSRREAQASFVLRNRGIETYLPQMPTRPQASRSETSLGPLFPGYLFARLDLEATEWLAARSAPGVAYFLGAQGVPSPLPDELVAGIRARAEASCNWSRAPACRRGDRVVIVAGPFAGMEAVFDRSLSPRGRVRVLLEIINRIVPMDVDARLIDRAG